MLDRITKDNKGNRGAGVVNGMDNSTYYFLFPVQSTRISVEFIQNDRKPSKSRRGDKYRAEKKMDVTIFKNYPRDRDRMIKRSLFAGSP